MVMFVVNYNEIDRHEKLCRIVCCANYASNYILRLGTQMTRIKLIY